MTTGACPHFPACLRWNLLCSLLAGLPGIFPFASRLILQALWPVWMYALCLLCTGRGDSHPDTLHSPTDAALTPRTLFFHFPGKERPVCFLPKKICVLILACILPFHPNAPVYIAAAEAQQVPQVKTTCLEATGNENPSGWHLLLSLCHLQGSELHSCNIQNKE